MESSFFSMLWFLLNISWKKHIFWSTPQETNYQDFQITGHHITGSSLLYFAYAEHFFSESSNVVAVTAKAPFMLCINFWNVFCSLLCRTFLHYHCFPFTWKNAKITAKEQSRSISLSYWLYKRKWFLFQISFSGFHLSLLGATFWLSHSGFSLPRRINTLNLSSTLVGLQSY